MTEPRLSGDLQGGFTPLGVDDWADYQNQYIYSYIPEYEQAYIRNFLNNVVNALQANIDAGNFTDAQAAQRLANISIILQTQGITSPYLTSDKELQDLGIKETAERFKDYIKGAATPVAIDGKNYLAIGGYFYNTTADRLPQEVQAHLTQQVEDLNIHMASIEEGRREQPLAEAEREAGEIKARREYFEQQRWWEKEGSEQIVGDTTMWKPEQAVGLSPEEAIRQGYASYTPEFNQAAYNQAFEEALRAEAWRLIGGGKPGAAGYTEKGYQTYGDVWKKLTKAQQGVVRQRALQAGAGEPTLYTSKELRDYSKQGIDVSAAAKATKAYQVEHPAQGVPYSQRGGDTTHISVIMAREAAAKAEKRRQEKAWEELRKRSLEKSRLTRL